MSPSQTKCTQQWRLPNRGKVISVNIVLGIEWRGHIYGLHTPSNDLSQCMEGTKCNDFVNEMANGGAKADGVGTVVDCVVSGCPILKELNGVYTRVIVL